MLLRRSAIAALFAASLCLLLAAGGCTSYLTETNPPKAWTPGRFKEVREENKQRLLGEDRGKSSTGDVLTYVPRQIWNGIAWTWNKTTGNTPAKYAKQMFDENPDLRRDAVYTLSDERFGRRPPYTKYYAQMAVNDVDPTVRAAAVRSLNRARASEFADTYVTAMSDSNEWVRLEAVKAIANIPTDKAVPTLTRLLADIQQTRDVRIAAADALREYRQSEVAQALIRVLGDRDFGVAWQARQSLNLMTGQDFKYDAAAWLEYLTRSQNPFPA